MAAYLEEDYEVPLRDQRYFGAGIKRKRVQFVASTEHTPSVQSLPVTPSGLSAADRYLNVVRRSQRQHERSSSAPPADGVVFTPRSESKSRLPAHARSGSIQDALSTRNAAQEAVCETCSRPIDPATTTAHESTLTHQIALQHSHPPSNVDRRRKGLAVLESQGWDPDARLGLGAKGSEGRLQPVKAMEKIDRAGIGAKVDGTVEKLDERAVKLDAGKAQVLAGEKERKAENLRNAFYRSEEVERYLGHEQMSAGLDIGAFRRARRRP